MSVPVLELRGLLIASLRGDLDDTDWVALRDTLLRRVGSAPARAVVIDVTGMDVLDSYAGRLLAGTAQALRLRGARTVVAGIQPGVAFAMVQLGMDLRGVTTALDLEDGVDALLGPQRVRPGDAR